MRTGLSRSTYLSYLLIALQLVASSILLERLVVCRNLSIHLDVARKMLSGAVIYKDIILANFPMAYLFRLTPAYISQQYSLNIITVNNIYTSVFCLGSIMLCYRLLKPTSLGREGALNLIISNALIFILFLWPLSMANLFGEKEHSILIFSLPYLMYSIRRLENITTSRVLSIIVIASMAMACAFKPFYIVVFVFAEIYIAYTKRSILSAVTKLNILFGVLLGLYLYYTFFITVYASNVVPILPLYYTASNTHLSQILHYFLSVAGGFVVYAYIYFLSVKKVEGPKLKRILTLLILVSIAGAILAVMQNKSELGYHRMVYNSYAFLFLVISSYYVIKYRYYKIKYLAITPVFLVFIISISFSYLAVFIHRSDSYKQQMLQLQSQYFPHTDKVFFMDMVMPEMVLMSDLKFINRYYSAWPLFGIANIEADKTIPSPFSLEDVARIKQNTVNNVIADLTTSDPQVIFLTNSVVEKYLAEDVRYRNYLSKFGKTADVNIYSKSVSGSMAASIYTRK